MSVLRTKTLAAFVLTGTLLAACGGGGTETTANPSNPTENDATCTADRVGGSVTMGVLSEAKGLDPTVTGGTGRTGDTELAAIYDTLMRYDQKSGKVVPQVAESLSTADNLNWVLKLRPNVKYSNGETLTAADVKANIERTKTGTNATPRSLAATVASADPVDDLTLNIKLTSPFGGFPAVLAGGTGMIVNPRVVASMSPDELNKMPTGAGVGPFVPEKYAPGEEIVLKARTDYWGGPVCIEQLRFVFISGAAATYEALQQDEIQLGFLREPMVIGQAKEAGYTGYSQVQNAGEALALNSGVQGSNPPTTDPRVRLAIQLALDTTLIDQRANSGKGLPTPDLIHANSPLALGEKGVAHDPAKAAALVAEVKAEKGWDGSVDFACDGSPVRQETALVVQAQLTQAGFKVNFTGNLQLSDLVTRVLTTSNYNISCWGLNVNDENPWVGLDQFRSDSQSNYLGYKNPAVDQAIADLKAATDVEGQKKALGAIQTAWQTDPGVAVLAGIENFIAYSKQLRGMKSSASNVLLFDKAFLEK
ncbi:ABC transporter substrate-binding protein [Phytohabitans kaempferiae]|uniref:ABC transporter substrate-binding protein n=1 Tax=Phytohabitans kaempferiae TaxID=1620943 RepID=A0ABV6LZ23_9ACTN